MTLFDRENDISIVLEPDVEEAVVLAASDLQRDLRKLSGKDDGFAIRSEGGGRGIYIRTIPQGEAESYTVSIEEEKILIVGADVLGTVFGIYAFATKCLHIQPMHLLVDLFPEKMEEMLLEPHSFSSGPRAIRFRGWFLNDEDLLTDWKISGGRRDIDYMFYQNVMDVNVLDRVLETALRLEINLIIPSSFVDIDRPYEEKLVAAVCRRGMYITQHHIEPLGVSWFGADRYLETHGCEGEEVSFINNRERMVEIWSYYVAKWAKYADHVVWQLGLRGKADRAVWQTDQTIPNSMESRGAIITDAIQTQYDIICRTLKHDRFYSTSTLWMEGSELYGKGLLKLPGNTIPIFSDNGLDQMPGADLYDVGLRSNRPFGLYYHVGFCLIGPHLSEGCNPEKMAYCYRDAAQNGKLCYSILNVSNVRPLHVSTLMNAKLLESPYDFNMTEELLAFDRSVFGRLGSRVNDLRKGYYGAFADFGEKILQSAAKEWHFYHRSYENLPFIRNAATDGQLAYFGKNVYDGKKDSKLLPTPSIYTQAELVNSAKKFSRLYQEALEIEKEMDGGALLYFRQFLKSQILYMHMLTEWCIASVNMMNESLPIAFRQEQGACGCKCLETILKERKVLEQGEWENWHRGDVKINIPRLLNLTREAQDGLK